MVPPAPHGPGYGLVHQYSILSIWLLSGLFLPETQEGLGGFMAPFETHGRKT